MAAVATDLGYVLVRSVLAMVAAIVRFSRYLACTRGMSALSIIIRHTFYLPRSKFKFCLNLPGTED
jgi:hypothetical protein